MNDAESSAEGTKRQEPRTSRNVMTLRKSLDNPTAQH
jgi:hypothetical protein